MVNPRVGSKASTTTTIRRTGTSLFSRARLGAVDITYNTKLVNPSEIRSYWNLLDAKWKSKIVTVDPLVAGPINTPQIFFYKHPDLGPEFLNGSMPKPT